MAAALMVVLANVLAIHAQAKNKHDLGKPFGWATCTSLDGGCFNLCGGEGGQSVTLVSDGSDMGAAIIKALKTYDIVILDGRNGPFTLNKAVTLSKQQNKSLIGINGATLRTAFKVTEDIKKKLDAAEVKKRSTQGNGGTLSNGDRTSVV